MDGPNVAVRKNWHAGNLPSKEGNNTEALSELYGDDMTSSKTCSTRSKCSFQIAGCPQTPDRELKLISDGNEALRSYAIMVNDEIESVQQEVQIDMKIPKCSDQDSPLPIYLKFTDIKYMIWVKPQWNVRRPFGCIEEAPIGKEILEGISGFVAPGEILAMMGPSGSGKTTLLNLLGGRVRSNYTGSITFNDMPYSKAMKRRMGFVTQDDILYPHLTVKETLEFAALLRLSNQLSKQEKLERADKLIVELGLDRCRETIIGGPFLRGVSGGERKRVCIGQEVLTDPSLLFLDEPTSGLDSTTAFKIIQLIQRFAQDGRTIITTIHQPSSRIYYMFDKLVLLSEGRTIYYGKIEGAMQHFGSIGFSPAIIPVNPSDFLLDLSNGDVSGCCIPFDLQLKITNSTITKETCGRAIMKLVQQHLVGAFINNKTSRDEQIQVSKVSDDLRTTTLEKRNWNSTWWQQFCALIIRGFKERRHEYFSWLRIGQVFFSAIVCGLIWWNTNHKDERGVQDQVSLLFFLSIYWGHFPLFVALHTFPQERAILMKERASDMYRLSSYFMSRIFGDLPLGLGLPAIFVLIIYFMTNLSMSLSSFASTTLSVFLIVITAEGLGLLIGAAMMDVKQATTFASILVLAFMLTGGFFVQHIGKFVRWLKYVSYNYYSFRLLIKVQYSKDQLFECNHSSNCKPLNLSKSLNGIELGSPLQEICALMVMTIGYRLIAYILLRRMKVEG